LAKKEASRKRAVKVKDSPNGKGVYAQKKLKKDSVIGEVKGEITDTDEEDPRYLMELDGDMLLRPKGTFRYLNHSCNPNCELFVWEDQELDLETGTRPLFVSALRNITEGQQLTIDYAWPADFAIPCNCKSKNCRGWIVDKGQLKKLKKKLAKKKKKKKQKQKKKK
jgi:SET domain-containing protein